MQESVKRIAKIKMVIALALAILFALLLTVISVNMYFESGTANLDLSRPGYEQVRDQVRPSPTNRTFEANGPIDDKSLDEFRKLYEEEMKRLESGSSFSDKSLSDEQLRLTTQPW